MPSTSPRPAACSGLMYVGVPSDAPVRVSGAASLRSLATPKSSTFATNGAPGSSHRNRLGGLMSRWTIPIACARSSAWATCVTSRATSGGVIVPSRDRRAPRSSPSSSSMTMYGPSSSEMPVSNTCTTCGLLTLAPAEASCAKRLRSEGLATMLSAMSLMTTSFWRLLCRASQTVPIPPAPMRRVSSRLGVTSTPGEARAFTCETSPDRSRSGASNGGSASASCRARATRPTRCRGGSRASP